MAKYIDADTMVGLILFDDTCGKEKTSIEIDTIENILDRFTKYGCPEPADVVQVCHCKDCGNWQTDWNPSIPDRHYCAVMDSMMKADDFCSYGEREE